MTTAIDGLPEEAWVRLLGADPRPWLLTADEPSARWVALTGLLDLPADDSAVREARGAVLTDPGTQGLIGRLPDWEADLALSGHNSPAFAPNLLNLLADMGLSGGDDQRVEHLLDRMLAHQDSDGRFASYGTSRLSPTPAWSALLCDAHAVVEVLVRFGRAEDHRTRAALARMDADIAETTQGRAWPCLPVRGFRGPGRKGDFCPQVTLEALRTFARLPEADRPDGLLVVARTALRAWQQRGEERPYMFGHGYWFKTVKWPVFWYDIAWFLDTLGRYPALWRGPQARAEDRQALAELAACLVAYNFDPDGAVVPRSCYKGFAAYSFGQKKRRSPYATAHLAVLLRRFADLAEEISAVDVLALPSAKGGTGTPRPPKVGR
ncbi:MAG: hypothetical protein M0Z94_18670 [Dehalococcoidales bacterium]|nr:hypothetical protein [Dehalococcoidales bacterium]